MVAERIIVQQLYRESKFPSILPGASLYVAIYIRSNLKLVEVEKPVH